MRDEYRRAMREAWEGCWCPMCGPRRRMEKAKTRRIARAKLKSADRRTADRANDIEP